MSAIGKILGGALFAGVAFALGIAAGMEVALPVLALGLVLYFGRYMPPNPTTRAEQRENASGDGGEP